MTVNLAMVEAMRLTRAGKLAEASQIMLESLSGAIPPTAHSNASSTDTTPRNSAHGTFEAHRHTSPAGGLDYMLFRPSGTVPGMPLVVMLHGCGQSPEDFALSTGMNELAEGMGFLVAYPRQTQDAHAHKCWNWYRPENQKRGRGEPALIAGMTHDIAIAEQIDPARIYVAGLSAGGAQAAIMVNAYPELYAAVGVHSGLACGAASSMSGALNAMQVGASPTAIAHAPPGRFVPVITFHGDSDRTVNEANARTIVQAATKALLAPVKVGLERGDEGGRAFVRAISQDDTGKHLIEQWTLTGSGHAWSGGNPDGSYADPTGPNASLAMMRFFLKHRNSAT